jgi:hypothetical protein
MTVQGALVVLLAILLPSASAQVIEMDLRKGGDWRWLYDSGLRPTRVESRSSIEAEIKNRIIRLVLPSGAGLEIDAESMFIQVLGSQKLAMIRMDVRGRYAREEARKAVEIYAQQLGSASEDFERFSDETAQNRRGYRQSISGLRKFENVSVGWTLSPAMFSKQPFSFSVSIFWDRADSEYVFAKEPLQPPLGYEQFPTEPKLGSVPNQVLPLVGDTQPQPSKPADAAPNSKSKLKSASQRASEGVGTSNALWWIVGIVCAVVVLVCLRYTRKHA